MVNDLNEFERDLENEYNEFDDIDDFEDYESVRKD
jgi:hypothetical protein